MFIILKVILIRIYINEKYYTLTTYPLQPFIANISIKINQPQYPNSKTLYKIVLKYYSNLLNSEKHIWKSIPGSLVGLMADAGRAHTKEYFQNLCCQGPCPHGEAQPPLTSAGDPPTLTAVWLTGSWCSSQVSALSL